MQAVVRHWGAVAARTADVEFGFTVDTSQGNSLHLSTEDALGSQDRRYRGKTSPVFGVLSDSAFRFEDRRLPVSAEDLLEMALAGEVFEPVAVCGVSSSPDQLVTDSAEEPLIAATMASGSRCGHSVPETESVPPGLNGNCWTSGPVFLVSRWNTIACCCIVSKHTNAWFNDSTLVRVLLSNLEICRPCRGMTVSLSIGEVISEGAR